MRARAPDATARARARVRVLVLAATTLLFAVYYLAAPQFSRRFSPIPTSTVAFRAAAALERPAAAAAPAPAPGAAPAVLLSAGRPARADVRGNLADAAVVTRAAAPGDWLTDRWQAASDMGGTPIPGEHWVEVDLERPVDVERVVLIWESAFATRYTIRGRLYEDAGWASIALGADAAEPRRDAQHIVHVLTAARCARVRFVRVDIAEPATRWGASLWRVEVHGREADAAVA
jgi:hypothetical protein